MRTFLGVACAATALVLAGGGPAQASPVFPGAGWVVHSVSTMDVTFKVATVHCASGENSLVVMGLVSPATATLDGWNAVALTGCASGHPWSRIQTWVNDVGGGHKVYDAAPGDLVRASLRDAGSAHPLITTTDLTTRHGISYRLTKPATTAAAGAYAGAMVPSFPHVNMNVFANNRPLSKLSRTKRIEYRGHTKLMAPSGAWGRTGENFSLFFWHH